MGVQWMRTEFKVFKPVWADTISIVAFVIAFWAIPIRQLDGLQFLPGDIGDSRLNNYFLEHVYQFVIGKAESLWHLPFFAPFPYVGGFSDNHFGTSVFYVLFRFLGEEPFNAFQLWFLLGYFLNFFTAYYVMRRFGGSPLAATFGALVFAFALPTTAHAGHVQLHYRFPLPLALFFMIKFCMTQDAKQLWLALLWMLWQFFCGVYMGFFTTLLMATVLISSFFVRATFTNQSLAILLFDDYKALKVAIASNLKLSFVLLFLFVAGFFLLFYPYLMVKVLYGFERGWPEIGSMMPRLQSYIISDVSTIWGGRSSPLFDLPMRHEHQMFPGLIATLLGVAGGVLVLRSRKSEVGMTIIGGSLLVVVSTISIFGVTLWYLFHWIPIASAIRAMVRIDQALLFPLAYLVMTSVNYLIDAGRLAGRFLAVVLLCLTVYEFSEVNMPKSSKSSWEDRIDALDSRLPQQIGEQQYLLVAKEPGDLWYAHELDVMWVAQRRGVDTMNGYSGNVPPGVSTDYGTGCKEIAQRVVAINEFLQKYKAGSPEISRADVFAHGFQNCN
jgi:hypothetical protein